MQKRYVRGTTLHPKLFYHLYAASTTSYFAAVCICIPCSFFAARNLQDGVGSFAESPRSETRHRDRCPHICALKGLERRLQGRASQNAPSHACTSASSRYTLVYCQPGGFRQQHCHAVMCLLGPCIGNGLMILTQIALLQSNQSQVLPPHVREQLNGPVVLPSMFLRHLIPDLQVRCNTVGPASDPLPMVLWSSWKLS